MIYGLGIDLVRIDRIKHAYDRFGERFARRILTAEEQQIFKRNNQSVRFLAMRFAAKEACSKAFGTGFKQGIAPSLIGVTQDPTGKPSLYLDGAARDRAKTYGIAATHVSLTDEGDYAAAVVILEIASP